MKCPYCKRKDVDPIYHVVVFESGYKRCYDAEKVADLTSVKSSKNIYSRII